MLATVDDGGWEPVANVKFQSEPVQSTVEAEIADEQVPPPPQFQADAEIHFSSISIQDQDKDPSLIDVASKGPVKQYVYGSDEEKKPKKATAMTTSNNAPSEDDVASHENVIEAEIREQQLREATLRQEAELRHREKHGGASSPSSHTSDEGFVDPPPEDHLLTAGGSPTRGFTHTITGSNGEPVIYDAISPVSDIYNDKVTQPMVPTHNSETKIALEIRELREREAELRAMRQLRQQELNALSHPPNLPEGGEEEEEELEAEIEGSSTRDLIEDHLTSLTTTTDEGNYSECGDAASSEDKSSDGSNSRIMSPDPHEPRQRRVTVKPFEDVDTEDTPIYTRMKKESVIEREIRLAKEREEAFRREKGLPVPIPEASKVLSSNKNAPVILDTSVNEKREVELDPPSRRSVKHILASNFIQQEIQQTSLRERELRNSGQIRTLSEETVDSKVTRLSDLSPSQVQKPRPTPSTNSLTLPKTPSSHSHSPLTKKNSPLSPNSPYIVPSFTPSPVHRPPAPTRLTRSLSTNNLSTPFGGPSTGAFRPKGLMQKFIASRGKITTPTFSNTVTPQYRVSSPPAPACANGVATRPMKLQPKNLVVRKELEEKQEEPSTKVYKRTQATAEEKIQEELREMKSREEELRRLRARNLARSQPNLAGMGDEEEIPDYEEESQDTCVSGVDSSSLHPQANNLRAVLSNPNLLDIETEAHSQPPIVEKGTRRKSALIAHWEGRIQQTSET